MRCCKEEDTRHQDREGDGERHRERSRRQRACPGAGIRFIESKIHDSIERHRRAARSDHCGDNPEDLPARGQASTRKKGTDERKGKGEDRVLKLDHLKRDLEFPPNQHAAIIMGIREL